MSWEQRLREMVLAGGALAAVACGDSAGTAGSTANEGGEDAPYGITTLDDVNFCCNVNPDPCCPVLHCGAAMNAACACQMAGGTTTGGGANAACSFPGEAGLLDGDASGDSGPVPQDAGPSDASSEVSSGEAGPGDAGGDGHD